MCDIQRRTCYSCCSDFLLKDIKKDHLHSYEKCVKDIKGKLYNIQESMDIHQSKSIVLTEEVEEQLLSLEFNIIFWHITECGITYYIYFLSSKILYSPLVINFLLWYIFQILSDGLPGNLLNCSDSIQLEF